MHQFITIFFFFFSFFKISKIKILIHIYSDVHSIGNYPIYVSGIFLYDYLTSIYRLQKGTDIVITTDEYDQFTFHNVNPFSKNQLLHFDPKINIDHPPTADLKFNFPTKNGSISPQLIMHIDEIEYKRNIEIPLYRRLIKPFTTQFLKPLQTDENTDFLVFFIDHGSTLTFGNRSFHFLLQKIQKIKTKHNFLFIDSCKSRSFCSLLKFSQIFFQS